MHIHIINSKEDIFVSSILSNKRANPKVENFKKSFRSHLGETSASQEA